MGSKPWYLSKTILVNSLTAAVAILTTLSGSELISANPKLAAGIVAMIGGVNIALRIITSLPLGA